MKNNELRKFEKELFEAQLRYWRAEDTNNNYVMAEEKKHMDRLWEIVSDLRKNCK